MDSSCSVVVYSYANFSSSSECAAWLQSMTVGPDAALYSTNLVLCNSDNCNAASPAVASSAAAPGAAGAATALAVAVVPALVTALLFV